MDAPEDPPRDTSTQPASTGDALTPRAIACGILLGSAVCFANTYFGLQAGIVNAMPMQSALLGFALFRASKHHLSKMLSPKETTTIEIVAGALGLAPFTSGFTAFIPALEFLTAPKEGGPVTISTAKLILWSIATCGLGIVAAAPFRQLFIFREKLRFPSATATGTLIGLLFGDEAIILRADQRQTRTTESNSTTEERPSTVPPSEALTNTDLNLVPADVEVALKVLLVSLAFSSSFSLIIYLVPVITRLPLFGVAAATHWLWAFDLSPAYFGYGIIIGPTTSAYTLIGAIIGWGILSPLAKHHDWAPGPVQDWDSGSRGWILWVGMGLILGDSTIGLGWFIFRPHVRRLWRRIKLMSQPERISEDAWARRPLLRRNSSSPVPSAEPNIANDHHWPAAAQNTSTVIVTIGIILVVLCLSSLLLGFRSLVTPLATLLAVLLVVPAGFISMRSLGETDNGAGLAIGRVAQLIVGLLVPSSQSIYMSANLLLGGLVESGASQAAQHMGGQKTAYMTGTAPRAVFYGQIIGSFVGTLIATLAYRVYTSAQGFPSKEFDIPDAHVWLVAARFIHQQGLPDKALAFSVAAFAIGATLSTLRIMGQGYWWQYLVPSGVAMSIGMYVVPAITLPRALGSLILVICRQNFGIKYFVLLCCATGLILGQGLFSIVALSLNSLFAPRA